MVIFQVLKRWMFLDKFLRWQDFVVDLCTSHRDMTVLLTAG